MGKDCLAELYRIIAPETYFISYDINEIKRNNQLIKEFTEDQKIVLDELADFSQVIVLGCAGSGKTQLAIAKVRQLIRQKNRVLFTCKSLNLAGVIYLSLQEIIEDENSDLSVISFGRLALNLARILRDNNNLEIKYLKTLGQYNELKFDAIIVDEGQDFTNEDIQDLKSLLKDANESIFYVFQDDNQNIHKNILGRKLKLNIHPRKLVKNLRNTKQIFEYFRPYVDGSNLTKPFGNEGPIVKIIEFDSMNQLINLLIQELDNLFIKSQITHNSIVIITNEDKNSSFLSENSQIGEHKIRYFSIIDDYRTTKQSRKNINKNVVKWSTVKEFKGLESDIVFYIQEKAIYIVANTEDINDRYIGYSRAKWMLVDFKEEEEEEDIW
ncbi:MAG: AAA family ATPase [Microcoleaceae cyanobacterium MO_207.B10]|nr:AAA family ATPase [Microcoleaceae cyanobacterium MO_207.B10]